MSERPVLVDTSAWLSVALPEHGPLFKSALALLNAENRAATNWLIRVELLTGCKDEQDYSHLNDELEGLRQLALHEEVWRYTARARCRLRRKGALLPLVDLTIASCAIVHECELLHADHHFDLIARHAPLKIYGAGPVKAR